MNLRRQTRLKFIANYVIMITSTFVFIHRNGFIGDSAKDFYGIPDAFVASD